MKTTSAEHLSTANFCMYPWTQLHAWPNGAAFPCCLADPTKPIGSLRHSTIAELWNGEPMRRLRLNMLANRPSGLCKKCYELEAAGGSSERLESIKRYAHHLPTVMSTDKDGRVARLNIAYLDIRFSNRCNFSCRTCGPFFSSKAYPEAIALGFDVPEGQALLHAAKNPTDLLDQLDPILDCLEEIHFAGGEPLLMEEHWSLLERLRTRNRQDVRIRYTTNFSDLKSRYLDAIELWRDLRVTVTASLDGMEERGEYLRKGQSWAQTIENRRRLADVCPNVQFQINCTVSIMNCLHVPDFHRAWVFGGLVAESEFRLNLLQDPSFFSLQTLPSEKKHEVTGRYRAYIELLHASGASFAAAEFENALRFMNRVDNSAELIKFVERTQLMDAYRQESFASIFPELASLVL